uniref:RRM domain-containing protein n=1 Tax=Populus trichocarpa TaxID=3694 RepID=B9I1C6_POPTR|eukprot:XP_002316790.1 polyadenylate-binding protein-interacting protein 9 isoform X1 [Populus trichocarpa]
MAAVVEIASEVAVAAKSNSNTTTNKNDNNNNLDSERNPKSESEFTVQKLVDMFTKLNPLAKEFFPSSYNKNNPKQFHINNFPVPNKQSANDNFPKRRRNDFNQGRRRLNGRAYRAQREDSIRRTVYVSDIDQHVTEEQLAGLFSGCGQVVDCRICGDPRSVLRFAFVEFAVEQGARAALNLGGTMLGYYPVRVLPSKTAILPVNPTFLPQSEDEREMCTRTVYCTNIEKKVSQAEVKNFFESICGEVTRLRLLGDHVHSTRIAFVEFAMAESAIVALNCSGMVLGSQPVRVSPSKTPVRPRVTRLALH